MVVFSNRVINTNETIKIGTEIINLTGKNVSNYIQQSYGTTIINATGIIRDICQYKYDWIYSGHIMFCMKAIMITLFLLIALKVAHVLIYKGTEKRFFGIIVIDENGIYTDYKKLHIPFQKEYWNEDIKKVLLLILVFRTIFVYLSYFNTFPFINIGGF